MSFHFIYIILLLRGIKAVFKRCRLILKTVKNAMDRPFVLTKTGHVLPADFKNGRLLKQNFKQLGLEMASCKHSKMMKTEHFLTLWE